MVGDISNFAMPLLSSWPSLAYGMLLLTGRTYATTTISLDPDDTESIKSTAATIAYGMMSYYTGNNTGDNPGNLPSPYYWWEAGALFGTMVDYWYYTNDTSYVTVTVQALISQIGDDDDYMPTNQTKTEGNDDQSFWGMAAMTAAELKFQDPDSDEPGWLALAQGVFNSMIPRWDTTTCGGGLKWQIFTFNAGYDYKNSIANGGFFNIAARLALYTDNSTYAEWAEKTWDWITDIGLIGDAYQVYDGTSDTKNCTELDHVRWSYNSGIWLYGAAAMWVHTNGSAVWEERIWGLLNATDVFFNSGLIMFESACETNDKCNVDESSFKAYLIRWMAATAKLAPFTYDYVMARLRPTAIAAAAQCTGSTLKTLCGGTWITGANDGNAGVGEMMSALEAVQSLLLPQAADQVTNTSGGTSVGNSNAGTGSAETTSDLTDTIVVTTAGRVGAGVITTFTLLGVLSGVAFVVS